MALTTIGDGLRVEGDIESGDDISVGGSVKGRLESTQSIVVEAGGTVRADIVAESLTVAGEVTGDVRARSRIELRAGGRLHGNIKTARLTLADGSAFSGNVEMET